MSRKRLLGERTGTYVMRGGKLTRISKRVDAELPSSKMRLERNVIWTDLPRNLHPAQKTWKHWTKSGLPVVIGDEGRKKYQKVCEDAGYHRDWVK